MWYNYVVGPMARSRGLGPGLDLKYDNCVAGRGGPGHTFLRAGPWPHNSVCGPGPVCTTAAGPGLKSYLRAGPGPKFQARAGP